MIPVIACVVLVFLVYKLLFSNEQKKIKGMPEVPGYPIVGNLTQLGSQHAVVCKEWARKHGPVFQLRFGNKRVVVANSYKAVKELWIDHQSATISRPMFHTFHSVVSSSQGFTIGTSPWDESCKKRRKAAATALNRPAVQSYMPIVDLESRSSIRDMFLDSKGGSVEINPKAYFQRFALNTSLTLNYGTRMEGVDNSLLVEIVKVEAFISRFRSTSNNWQDYIPALRLFSSKNASADEYRVRRDNYMNKLLAQLKEDIAKGVDKSCITGNILKDPDAKLNDAEIRSIGLTMVSAGLDTVPANILQGLAFLTSSKGQDIQQKAYDAIMEVYQSGEEAWDAVLKEERIPYITALVKEVLRYYTVINMSLPRQSIKDITYDGIVIPAGTIMMQNSYAADFDDERFPDPYTFQPERYLDEKLAEGVSAIPHFAFGAGSRMCAGAFLAHRELVTAFTRLLVAFKLYPSETMPPETDPLKYNAYPTALVAEPKVSFLLLVEEIYLFLGLSLST